MKIETHNTSGATIGEVISDNYITTSLKTLMMDWTYLEIYISKDLTALFYMKKP
jgi:hypothetical protein